MAAGKKASRKDIEGHYDYYGVPAYILKQKNGAYASGFYDPIENVFKAGGSVKKILWDGIKVSLIQAKRLIRRYSRNAFNVQELDTPDWILLPEEATTFLEQCDRIRDEGAELLRKLRKAEKKTKNPDQVG